MAMGALSPCEVDLRASFGAGRPMRSQGWLRAIRPVVVSQQDLATLREILPDEGDASHLFQTIGYGVEYFVTHDKATILCHATAIEKKFPSMLLRLPSELATELEL